MEIQSRKSLQSTVYQITLYLRGYKKDKIFEVTKKGSHSKLFGMFGLQFSKIKPLNLQRKKTLKISKHLMAGQITGKKDLMSFKRVSGESKACTNEMVAPWEQTTLPTILPKYDLNQIYNANEFGLFYRPQPNNSLYLKNENCICGKHSKLHLTGLTAANTVGEKLPLFATGKSKKP